jgi:hypothetical protein
MEAQGTGSSVISPSVQACEAERRAAIKVLYCGWATGQSTSGAEARVGHAFHVEHQLNQLATADMHNQNLDCSKRREGAGGQNKRISLGAKQAGALIGGTGQASARERQP